MDILNNLSCCCDASKDLAETGVELVVCNCRVSQACCIRWEIVTYVLALVFSMMDFFADLAGYITFSEATSERGSISTYMTVWLVFLILSGVILLSEVILPLYSICVVQACCGVRGSYDSEQTDSFRRKTKYWNRVNSFAVILSEDGVIALTRILIAFRSADAVLDLQSTSGWISALLAFVVTFFRHWMLMIQLVIKLRRNKVLFSRCPPWSKGYCDKSTVGLYLFYLTVMLVSCCAMGATGMSMLISFDQITIYYNDQRDFLLNSVLLSTFIPGAYILSLFIIGLVVW